MFLTFLLLIVTCWGGCLVIIHFLHPTNSTFCCRLEPVASHFQDPRAGPSRPCASGSQPAQFKVSNAGSSFPPTSDSMSDQQADEIAELLAERERKEKGEGKGKGKGKGKSNRKRKGDDYQ